MPIYAGIIQLEHYRNTTYFVCAHGPCIFSEADNSSPTLSDRIKVFLGSDDLSSPSRDPGTVFAAVSLHIHPERIKLEETHRKKQEGKSEYLSFAGHYDITLVKLNRFVAFKKDRVG